MFLIKNLTIFDFLFLRFLFFFFAWQSLNSGSSGIVMQIINLK
ncbi:hypothetical protein BH695_0233 [Microcystis aeruginosa PCC 7806SL]|uniref:Uncharacterized protein n=1 Tax=Microcystis aeruginosa PCC 7806SL TaxID=1903187 RepID=A0AB33BMU4_MICA7|nr:hypothetical protein BH695_0233 [Microcystis aeruginosa PCC 7806SL]